MGLACYLTSCAAAVSHSFPAGFLKKSCHTVIRMRIMCTVNEREISGSCTITTREDNNIMRMHLRIRASNDFGIVTTPTYMLDFTGFLGVKVQQS